MTCISFHQLPDQSDVQQSFRILSFGRRMVMSRAIETVFALSSLSASLWAGLAGERPVCAWLVSLPTTCRSQEARVLPWVKNPNQLHGSPQLFHAAPSFPVPSLLTCSTITFPPCPTTPYRPSYAPSNPPSDIPASNTSASYTCHKPRKPSHPLGSSRNSYSPPLFSAPSHS